MWYSTNGIHAHQGPTRWLHVPQSLWMAGGGCKGPGCRLQGCYWAFGKCQRQYHTHRQGHYRRVWITCRGDLLSSSFLSVPCIGMLKLLFEHSWWGADNLWLHPSDYTRYGLFYANVVLYPTSCQLTCSRNSSIPSHIDHQGFCCWC